MAPIVLLKESVEKKINALIWFRWMKKKTSSLIEDKRKDKVQMAHTHRNPKRHIPLVSLLLLHKMVDVHCFVWPLGLQWWSGSQAVSLKSKVLAIFRILYPATCKCFVVFNAVLCIIWTSTIP